MHPRGLELNVTNLTSISCGVKELLSKVHLRKGGNKKDGSDEVGLRDLLSWGDKKHFEIFV